MARKSESNAKHNPAAVAMAANIAQNDPGFRDCVCPEYTFEEGRAKGWVPKGWTYPRFVWENAYAEARESVQMDGYYVGLAKSLEACPGCDCMPGDGRTDGCNHPDGCGFYRAF